MNYDPDEVLAFLVRAVGEAGAVRYEGSDHVAVRAPGATWCALRLASWREEYLNESEREPTLWVLRRPRRAELEALRATGRSYVALNGAVRLQTPGLLVDRTDLRPMRRQVHVGRRSAFSDRASLIPRWLFGQPTDSEWSITGMARAIGVSPSVASYAVLDLERRQLVEERTGHPERWIRLVDHRQLVAQWAQEYDWKDNVGLAVDVPLGSTRRFLLRLQSMTMPRWAATLHAGASLLLPHAPPEQVHVYVDVRGRASLAELAETLGWRADPEGAVKLLAPRHRTSIWPGVRDVEGIPVVSDLQLLIDLWNHPLRGREQAEVILEKHLHALGQA